MSRQLFSSFGLDANSRVATIVAKWQRFRDNVWIIITSNCYSVRLFISRVICEDGSGRSVSDFLCRNNIFLFLHALVSHFELTQSQLFSPEDLYLCKDISKVFRTLSELSHTPKVLKSGVAGFPRKEKLLSKRLKSERGNYEQLENLYGQAGTEDVYDSFTNRIRLRDKENMYYNEGTVYFIFDFFVLLFRLTFTQQKYSCF